MYHEITPEDLAMVLCFCNKFMNKEAHKKLLERLEPIRKDVLRTTWDQDAQLVIMEKPF